MITLAWMVSVFFTSIIGTIVGCLVSSEATEAVFFGSLGAAIAASLTMGVAMWWAA